MSVAIRLKRVGKKKHPFYRVVVQDSRSATRGNIIEELGTYSPVGDKLLPTWDRERVQSWLNKGAIPSDTVKSMLKREKLQGSAA